ncbi:T9SS type A sorting domain-containing protein [Flavobacterium sp.]|uniref:T9SS type A sorting domain-containing protein n=1 Tax=Flavobacterium sp. TaxID=239 RepID=UPI003750D747
MFIQKKITSILLFIIALSPIFSFAQNTGQGQYLQSQTLQHSSGNRQYSIYIPANYNSSQPVPLVLLFHGFTNSISSIYSDSQMEVLADANNFIYAIPQGLGGLAGWSIGLSFGGNADDIGFASSLIDRISSVYNINNKRVYAAGFSNGGFFSYRLACELSTKIAAIASVAGSMNPSWIGGNNPTCNPQHQMPIMQITGTNDNVIPINGGNGGAPLSNVFNYWKNFNNTNPNPITTNINSNTERNVYENGNNGSTIEFIKITGRGHEWPKTTTAGLQENASIRIWEFFSRYDKDGLISTLSTNSFEKTGISIYPNPANSVITINNVNFTEKISYTLTSIMGQIVKNGKIISPSQRIDIENLPPSIYFLNIENNSFKIIKTE